MTISCGRKTTSFFRSEIADWHPGEILFGIMILFSVCLPAVMAKSFLTISFVSMLTGVLYTLLAGKGKVSCYFFGIINSVLYGYLSYRSNLYGDMFLNWLWYLPMQFFGIACWLGKRNPATGNIRKRKLTPFFRLLLTAGAIVVWGALAVVLKISGDHHPYLDSATNVLSTIAMLLGVFRCFEQWICWFLVNLISVYIWFSLWKNGNGDAETLLMWCAFLICGIVFAVDWYRASSTEEQE